MSLNHLEKNSNPSICKVLANSKTQQIHDYIQQSSERGSRHYGPALISAAHWLADRSLNDLESMVPDFIQHHKHRIPCLTRESHNLPLKQLLQTTPQEEGIDLLNSFITAFPKAFSESTESVLKQRHLSMSDLYLAWHLAKIVVSNSKLFAF